MKKLLILTALLLALLLPISALAGTSVVLDASVSTTAGQTTIRWTPGDLPAGGYKVIIQAVNSNESGSLMQLAGDTTGSSIVTGLLAPNKTYIVYVTDSDYNILGMKQYTMPDVPVFQDGKLKDTSIKISTELRRSDSKGKYKKVKSFKASEMNEVAAGSSDFFCMKYQMRMPQLIRERAFYVQLVFESPNGYTFTDKATDITFDRIVNGYQTIWWEYAGADFFDALYRQTGSIPAGPYSMTLYWDGCWVNTSTFNVN